MNLFLGAWPKVSAELLGKWHEKLFLCIADITLFGPGFFWSLQLEGWWEGGGVRPVRSSKNIKAITMRLKGQDSRSKMPLKSVLCGDGVI